MNPVKRKADRKVKKLRNEKNLLFPGRPNYEGPTEGFFGLLHHSELFEYSANVMERVDYVKKEKDENEVEIRLYSMIFLPFVYSDFYAKWQTEQNAVDAKRQTERDAVDAKWRKERDAVDAKWQTERDAVDAKWRKEQNAVDAKWRTEQNAVDVKWRTERRAVDAKWQTEQNAVDAPILNFIKKHIPDCAWNDGELIFS